MKAKQTVYVNEFTNGIHDPNKEMLGPVQDGVHIILLQTPLGITVPEVMNRATITGSIEIGRHPGVVTITFLAPTHYLDKVGLTELIKEQYQRSLDS
ncbi:hypothetical protein IQ10_03068 [Halalkalibacter nanhaiisediminis]|uniref:Uncharacterized protein n=1 Tax=Halalkalibacter nanhaiisediminis TaxID=688079 RepID=A0A562QCN2_9BACI|nr:hypothetical protein IQ10_03068 [Halalkalibacter nanhaiisediminis]